MYAKWEFDAKIAPPPISPTDASLHPKYHGIYDRMINTYCAQFALERAAPNVPETKEIASTDVTRVISQIRQMEE